MSHNTTHAGLLHCIKRPAPSVGFPPPPLTAFEHIPSTPPDSPTQRSHTLIFLGGLFDSLLTVPYTIPLVSALPSSWSLVEPVLGSSFRQAGFTSLGEDVTEIAQLVAYFRQLRPGGKVVLMGHSTGSQKIMYYLLSERNVEEGMERPRIDGGIMQAGCSDREVMGMGGNALNLERVCDLARAWVLGGKGEDVLPLDCTSHVFGKYPVSASRWLSLASPAPDHAGEDDYFSSDFEDERLERTFGRLGETGSRLCWLYSGSDEYVPAEIDKEKLIERWHVHARKGNGVVDESSGVVEGASHTLKEGGPGMENLVKRVVGFLGRVLEDER